MAERKSNLVRAGALWLNKSKSGLKYMAGSLNLSGEYGEEAARLLKGADKVKVLIFKNENKEEDTHPDYNIFFAPPEDDDNRGRRSSRDRDEARDKRSRSRETDDEDIPF